MTYPSGGSYPPPSSSTPSSTTAIISLVAGVLGLSLLPFVGSIVAIITGNTARREIRESGGAISGDGLATAGLVLGWIGIGLGVVGICVAGLVIVVPLCLLTFGIAAQNTSNLLPLLISLI